MGIPFFRTTVTGEELKYLQLVLNSGNTDAFAEKSFVAKCEQWFSEKQGIKNFYLTKSCTDSLELAAIILDIKPGDEIILPSYAFVSCANAFALRGANCVFVDVLPGSMTIDETQIEAAITPNTKAIVTLNYASVACNYKVIKEIATRNGLFIVEDNAHGTGANYAGAALGSFGDISTFSFDHMKNISCGQGGGIAINNPGLLEKFFIHYEFGTNRRSFMNGQGDRYEWKNIGSNYPISELNAAMLYAQLLDSEKINGRFMHLWSAYNSHLNGLEQAGIIDLPKPAQGTGNNGHCFFIKVKNGDEKKELVKHLRESNVNAQFHYTPLHSSNFGKMNGRFAGEDRHTTKESQRLLRLPLFYAMKDEELDFIVARVKQFYNC